MTTTLWTVLGVIGTALIGAVVARLVALIFEWRSRLIVRVTANQSFQMRSLFEEVGQLGEAASLETRKLLTVYGKYHQIFSSENYLRMVVRNNSNKKLSGLTFCSHSPAAGWLQINDGELIEIKSDVPFSLGELQPRREITLHLLAGSLFFGHTIKDLKQTLTFSADELGRVAYKFPLPDYQRRRIKGWASTTVIWFVLFWLAVSIIAQFVIIKP